MCCSCPEVTDYQVDYFWCCRTGFHIDGYIWLRLLLAELACLCNLAEGGPGGDDSIKRKAGACVSITMLRDRAEPGGCRLGLHPMWWMPIATARPDALKPVPTAASAVRTQASLSYDQRRCWDCVSDLGVWCRCVSAAATWLQDVRRLFAACGLSCCRWHPGCGAGGHPRLGPAPLGAVSRAGGFPPARTPPLGRSPRVG